MSLINSLLKDLEKRQGHKEVPYLITRFEKKPNKRLLFAKAIFSLFVITLIGFLVFAFIKHYPTSSEKAGLTLARATKPSVVVKRVQNVSTKAVVIDPIWTKPVLITGMTIEVKENITEITFLLNHQSLYRLIGNGIQNQLAVVLENAELQAELPHVSKLETAIDNITSQKTNGDLRFNIVLNSDSIIKYVALNTEKTNPELVIAIEKLRATNVIETEKGVPIIKRPIAQNILLQQYQLALAAVESNEYHIGIQKLTAILKAEPHFHEARSALATIFIKQGKKQQAEQLLNTGLQLSPTFPAFIELKARILTAQGKIQQSINLLQTAIPPINDNPDYHAFMAALYQRNNDDVLAVNIYNQLLAKDPSNSNWWLGLGISLEKTNKPKDAVRAYTYALSNGNLELASVGYLKQRLKALADGNEQS